jgi:TonB family protein
MALLFSTALLFALEIAALGQTADGNAPTAPGQTTPVGIGRPHTCTESYPERAKEVGADGTTVLAFTIRKDGTIEDLAVDVTSGNADLDAAAMDCAKTWTYKPAVRDGVPIAERWKVSVVWRFPEPSDPVYAAMADAATKCVAPERLSTDDISSVRRSTVMRVVVTNGVVASSEVITSSGDPVLDKRLSACWAAVPGRLTVGVDSRVLVFPFAWFPSGLPVSQPNSDSPWARCSRAKGDIAIGACTGLIDAAAGDKARFALFYRGRAYLDTHQYDLAIHDFDAVIRLKPDFAEAFANRGRVYMATGKFARALQDCDEAIRLKPDFAGAFRVRASIYVDLGQNERAVHDLSEVIRLTPTDAGALGARCYIHAMQNEDLDQAEKDCTQALTLDTTNAGLSDARALIYYRLARFADAIDDENQALTKNPKSAASLYLRGIAERRLGSNAEGDKDIAAAKVIDPKAGDFFKVHGINP